MQIISARLDIGWCEVGHHNVQFIVQVHGMAESKRTHIALFMFSPVNSGMNNHGASGATNGFMAFLETPL